MELELKENFWPEFGRMWNNGNKEWLNCHSDRDD